MSRVPGGLLVAWWLRHYAYYAWPAGRAPGPSPALCGPWLASSPREWAMYCLTPAAILAAIAGGWRAARAIPGWPGRATIFALSGLAAEEVQALGCGLLQWGQIGAGDMCRRVDGMATIQALGLSAAVALLITGAIYGRAGGNR